MFYRPAIFQDLKNFTAGLTYSNRNSVNTDLAIQGLNFGDNTDTPAAIVDQNYNRLFNELNWEEGGIAIADQVHGNQVKNVTKPGFYQGYDGFITEEVDLALGIKVADCAALLFADPVNRVVAGVHAGWRGAAADIVPNVLKMFTERNSTPSEIRAYISPCISVENFEVGEEVASEFPSEFIKREFGAKPHLDLKSFLKYQLLSHGLLSKHMEIDKRCTIEDDTFYSFRRERDKAGRMLAFITYGSN